MRIANIIYRQVIHPDVAIFSPATMGRTWSATDSSPYRTMSTEALTSRRLPQEVKQDTETPDSPLRLPRYRPSAEWRSRTNADLPEAFRFLAKFSHTHHSSTGGVL